MSVTLYRNWVCAQVYNGRCRICCFWTILKESDLSKNCLRKKQKFCCFFVVWTLTILNAAVSKWTLAESFSTAVHLHIKLLFFQPMKISFVSQKSKCRDSPWSDPVVLSVTLMSFVVIKPGRRGRLTNEARGDRPPPRPPVRSPPAD